MKKFLALGVLAAGLMFFAGSNSAEAGGCYRGGGGFYGAHYGGFYGGRVYNRGPVFHPGFNRGFHPGFNRGFHPGFNRGFYRGSGVSVYGRSGGFNIRW